MVVAHSKDVARFFGKRHDNVIRDIESIRLNLEGNATTWFQIGYHNTKVGFGYRTDAHYEMTRDGFAILVMGYNGARALEFKVRYIQEFNRMEAELAKQQALTTPKTHSPADSRAGPSPACCRYSSALHLRKTNEWIPTTKRQ